MAKKKVKTFDPMKYRIEINWSPEDDAYVVRVPELPGCSTHGDSPEHALEMAKEAIQSYVQSIIDDGEEPPIPLSEQEFKGEFLVRADPILHRNLRLQATREKTSFNKYVVAMLRKAAV